MKFNFKYVYIIVAVLVIALLTYIIISRSDTPGEKEFSESNMPEDDIHGNMKAPHGMPGKANVAQSFLQLIDSLKTYTEKNPKDTAALAELAELYTEAHNMSESAIYFEKILKIDPNRKDVMFALAELNYRMQDIPNSEKYLRSILKLDPKNELASYNLGIIYVTQGNKTDAKKVWEKLALSESDYGKLAKEALKNLQ
ncbi:MAG: tetratricopeptide repeat protein [Ignavibacteria bacterium]|nr:tetratricopeptide repeat protein [Ignavibacteria bacterium]